MKNLIAAATLIEQAGLAVQGVSLFINTLPADCTQGVMLRNPLTGIEIDEGHKGFFSAEFQVIVRDPRPETGYARALAIADVLKIAAQVVGDVTVSWMTPCHLPVQYARGDADDIETAFDVRVGFGHPV